MPAANRGAFALHRRRYRRSVEHAVSGKGYDKNSDGFWLSDKYAAANNVKIGDTLTVSYRSVEISGEIVGLAKSGEFMVCVADSNQLMSDFSSFGFAYASPEKVKSALGGFIFYPQINVLSDMEKPQMEQAVKYALGIGLCAIVINPSGMMGTYMDLPDWRLHIRWWTWLLLIGIIAFLALISFLSVKTMLKGTAADALRPYVPPKAKPLAIEKTKVWDKMSFATKWNLRDVFRHKTRSIMTLIGVIGCMLLLVGGLGMRDTMTVFLDTIDKQILNYETRVNFAETVTNEQATGFAGRRGRIAVVSYNACKRIRT